MLTSIPGYPRIGAERELKFATEAYFKKKSTAEALLETAASLRRSHWQTMHTAALSLIPSGDFSFYDGMLDTAVMLGVVPLRYRALGLSPLDTYFAMARGHQDGGRDIRALAMKKWFNTNYHYIVPEIDDTVAFQADASRLLALHAEAAALGIDTKAVVIGPLTFLKLSLLSPNRDFAGTLDALADAYCALLSALRDGGIKTLQIDEPILVTDLSEDELSLFETAYKKILGVKNGLRVNLQTYFGDVRDAYGRIMALPFDAVGLDFVEGVETMALLETHGFAQDKLLIAGLVNGKNIWRNDYSKTLSALAKIAKHVDSARIVLGASCSLLHSPYTVAAEKNLTGVYRDSLAFANEKLGELQELTALFALSDYNKDARFVENQRIIRERLTHPACLNPAVRTRTAALTARDYRRASDFDTRRAAQHEKFKLPALPTTTIGSFPQTAEIQRLRRDLRRGVLTEDAYNAALRTKIDEVVRLQEDIGLDVLVHGEYERNDMVEYFGHLLDGFIFTENGWVQSYGTRGVKPPVIFGDVSRSQPLTVEWSAYAQSLTKKPMKGMLTGPITILNWSFVREDLDPAEITRQIGLAIGDEVVDLEKNGIEIIQIDEAALREKLPLRQADWRTRYLDWAIPAFRLTASRVQDTTQIHTHMCYSEFSSIVDAIEAMDADVITIEAARSDYAILDFLVEQDFKLEIGLGVYDIHSPRIPSEDELTERVRLIVSRLDPTKVWVNPDCGLKTRGFEETVPSLRNMVAAARTVRAELA